MTRSRSGDENLSMNGVAFQELGEGRSGIALVPRSITGKIAGLPVNRVSRPANDGISV
jgi:hypothetical protein